MSRLETEVLKINFNNLQPNPKNLIIRSVVVSLKFPFKFNGQEYKECTDDVLFESE